MSILAIFQLMTISPGFFLEGRKSFASCKKIYLTGQTPLLHHASDLQSGVLTLKTL